MIEIFSVSKAFQTDRRLTSESKSTYTRCVFLTFLDTLRVKKKKPLLCPTRIWKKPPFIPPPVLIYWFSSPPQKGTDYRASSLQKKGKVIRSACNPVRAFQAAVLSILFGYVKNVEYQQWVSVPYCWVLYELILLQSQKKEKKRKKDLRLGQKVYSSVHFQLPVHSVTDRQSEETLVLVLGLSSDSPQAFCSDPWCVGAHLWLGLEKESSSWKGKQTY